MKKSVLPGVPISIVKKTGNRSFPFIKGKQPITGPWVDFLKLDYKLTNPSSICKDSLFLQFIKLDLILTNPLPISKRTGNRSFPFIKGKKPITGPLVEFLKLDYELTNPSSIYKDSLSLQFIQLDFLLTNPFPISKRNGNRSFPFIKGKQPITGPWVEFLKLDYKLTNPSPI